MVCSFNMEYLNDQIMAGSAKVVFLPLVWGVQPSSMRFTSSLMLGMRGSFNEAVILSKAQHGLTCYHMQKSTLIQRTFFEVTGFCPVRHKIIAQSCMLMIPRLSAVHAAPCFQPSNPTGAQGIRVATKILHEGVGNWNFQRAVCQRYLLPSHYVTDPHGCWTC